MDDWSNSSDGLSQKLKQLNTVLEAENQKLNAYKSQLKAVKEAEEENGRRVETTRQAYEDAVRQYGEASDEAKSYKNALTKLEQEQSRNAKSADSLSIKILNQTAAVNKTEKSIRQYNKKLDDLQSESKSSANDSQKLEKSLQDVGDSAKTSESKLSGFARSLAGGIKTGLTAVAATAAAAVTGFLGTAEASREWNNDLIKLEQNTKNNNNNFQSMKGHLRDLTALTGETDSSIEALSNIMAAGFDDNQAAQAIDALSGAVIKFPDTLKIESLADSLQETIKTGEATGQFSELVGRLGGNVDSLNKRFASCTNATERQQVALEWLAKSGLSEVNKEYQEANKQILDYEKAQLIYRTQWRN